MIARSWTVSSAWIKIAAVGIGVAIPLVYLIYLPVSYSFDGTVFSHMLRSGLLKHDWLGLVQVHHLAYFPLNYLAYRALATLFQYHVLEFFHLQLFSMIFAMATLVLVERMLKKLGLTLALRLAGVTAIAFCFAFWQFAVDAEVHIPGLFFVAAGMYFLMNRRDRTWPLLAAALAFATAAAFHLTNVLALAAAILVLVAERVPWKRTALFGAAYATAMLLMFGAYSLLSGKNILGTFAAGLAGVDPYSGYRIAYARPLSWPTLASSLASLKTALATGNGALPWVILAFSALLLLLGCLPNGERSQATARRALLIWPLPYFAFFSWWDPGNFEFKIHVVVPLLLVALAGLARLRPRAGLAAALLLAVALLGNNLASGIAPQADSANNANYQVAMAINRATPAGAQVLITGTFSGYGYGKIYIPYFAGREVVVLDWLLGKGHPLPAIVAELKRRDASGRPLFALPEIAAPGRALADLLDFHKVDALDRALLAAALRFVPIAALPGGQRLYRVEFTSP